MQNKKRKIKIPKIREFWPINPVTKIKPSAKVYTRKNKSWKKELEK